MFNKKSYYALNKSDRDAIVYTDASNNTIRLTRDDFDTEADFLKWKQWSDENYHEEEKRDHRQADHSVASTDLLEVVTMYPSPEIVIEHRVEKQEQERITEETIIRIKGMLTESQFRRLWMYHVEGLTETEIAEREAVGQSRVSKSIRSAKKKIKKFFDL